MTTHLCLVSAQVTPNLTPLTDPATIPDAVILAVSRDMQRQADWLEETITPRGIKVSRWPIDAPFDIEHCRDQIERLLLEQPDHRQLILNATGGTKPMSIAAYEVFRQENLPIFYVHPEQDRLIWLHPKDRQAIDLADRLKLEGFLSVHGAAIKDRLTREGIGNREYNLCDLLVTDIGQFSGPLKSLNWLAHQAGKDLRAPPLNDQQLGNPALEYLLDHLSQEGFLLREGKQLRFSNESDRFFVNGGWLELYVFDLCAQLRKEQGLQDLARSIEVQRSHPHGNIPNEIDVAALRENRLFIMECKTKQWDPQKQGPGADALYKLDVLKDLLGGLNAKAMLISYQPLPRHDRQRAEDLRIKICAGEEIQQLKQTLQSWIWP
jgi:hypothetical protein